MLKNSTWKRSGMILTIRQYMDWFLWTLSSGLITAESDKFLIGMKPDTPLSIRILTPTALPGQVPASKWFQTSVNSGKSSWPQNGHCQAFPSPEKKKIEKIQENRKILPVTAETFTIHTFDLRLIFFFFWDPSWDIFEVFWGTRKILVKLTLEGLKMTVFLTDFLINVSKSKKKKKLIFTFS